MRTSANFLHDRHRRLAEGDRGRKRPFSISAGERAGDQIGHVAFNGLKHVREHQAGGQQQLMQTFRRNRILTERFLAQEGKKSTGKFW